jgi:hypothetical protein
MEIKLSAIPKVQTILSLLLLISLSGCKFYYSVDQANGQLSKTSQDAQANSDRLNKQIKDLLKQYEEMNCNDGNPNYTEAKKKSDIINADLVVMSSYGLKIKDAYNDFSNYSKGKSKIESGTPEWKKFKTTRNEIKENAKLLQKSGESNIKQATAFHKFVEEKIVPGITYCDVPSTLNQFETALKDLGNSQKKFNDEFGVFEKEVSVITNKFSAQYPDKCNSISEKIKKIKLKNSDITKVKSGMLQETSKFRKATSGKNKIYSCSTDWQAVKDSEQGFNNLKNELSSIERNLQELSAQIKQEISELK